MAAILLAIIVVAIFIFTDRTTVNVSITKTPVVTGEVLTAVAANPYDICYIPIAWQSGDAMTDCSNTWSYVWKTCYTDGTPCVVYDKPAPTTGSITVKFSAQPTKLAGNYSDNGAILRAWAAKNIKTLNIPAEAKNAKIGFKFTKLSKNKNIPGNIQAWVAGKKLCNWRLSTVGAIIDNDTNIYWYNLDKITIQNSYNWYTIDVTDRSIAIGKTLTIQARVGENRNRIEFIIVDYDL